MTKGQTFRWGAAVGALLVASIAAGLYQMHTATDAMAVAAQKDTTSMYQDSSRYWEGKERVARGGMMVAHAEAAELEHRAAEHVATVHNNASAFRILQAGDSLPGVGLTPKAVTWLTGQDTTRMSLVARAIDDKPFLIPTFFVQAYQDAITALYLTDSSAKANRRLYIRATLVIAAQDQGARADSLIKASQERTITLLEDSVRSVTHPRCGRRCGVVIGASAAGLAVYLGAKVVKAGAR